MPVVESRDVFCVELLGFFQGISVDCISVGRI